MSDGPYREAGREPGEETHCLFCGARRNDATGNCVTCGAWTASPSHDESPSTGFPCPRCNSPLAAQSFGRAIVKACAHCYGLYCPALQFSLLLNDYLANVELPLATLKIAPPGEQPKSFAMVNCVACGAEMDRVNFASRSDAIVDVCTKHGMWLDAGELIPILHFVKTRDELGEVPLTDPEREDEMALKREGAESARRQVQNMRRADAIGAMLDGGSPQWTFFDSHDDDDS